jgi:hypothetical protein
MTKVARKNRVKTIKDSKQKYIFAVEAINTRENIFD